MKDIKPIVSIVMPVLNAQRTLELSLKSIKNQDFFKNCEIILSDGGSTDNTLSIAKKYGAKIVSNPLKTGESGKAIGVRLAKGRIIALIDSDNVLPERNWLSTMVSPFDDKTIIASEPLHYSYRKSDHWLTRYFALIGMGDPLNLFIGNYDRYSYISNKWTGLGLVTKTTKYGKEVTLKDKVPTIGANGFLIRKKDLEKYNFGKYLFDIDVIKFLSKKRVVKIAKVNTGIVHLFSGNVSAFIRKQKRRARDYFYHRSKGTRINDDTAMILFGVVKFVFATILIFPLFVQVVKGWFRKKDVAWLFHPVACWITLAVYGTETIRSIFITEEMNRLKWSQ